MTPLTAYHLYCAKYNVSPDPDAPEAVQAATLPYVSAKHHATAAGRALLRQHRAAREGKPSLFSAKTTPAQLTRATGLAESQALAALNAWRRAHGHLPYTAPKPPPLRRELPTYTPPPPLDPADPIADYHARVGADDAIRFRDLVKALGLSDHATRNRYLKWCAAANTSPKRSPPGAARPWLAYALARRAEGYTPAEIAAAVGVNLHQIQDIKDP